MLNAIFGTLTVLLLTLVDPLAACCWHPHVHNQVRSQIMLEAFPALTSLLTVLTYLQWKKGQRPGMNGWLTLSAFCLGLDRRFQVSVLCSWDRDSGRLVSRRKAGWILQVFPAQRSHMGTAGSVVFFVCDPYLWPIQSGDSRNQSLSCRVCLWRSRGSKRQFPSLAAFILVVLLSILVA